MDSYRFFTIQVNGEDAVARAVDDRLQGIAQAEFVKEELTQIVQASPRTLVIDFTQVKMLSSYVIASLLVVKSRATIAGTKVKLTMTDSLRTLFDSLNLDGTVFEIYSSPEQAFQSGSHSNSYFDVCGQVSPPDEECDVNFTG